MAQKKYVSVNTTTLFETSDGRRSYAQLSVKKAMTGTYVLLIQGSNEVMLTNNYLHSQEIEIK
jgi:hypothetical protein